MDYQGNSKKEKIVADVKPKNIQKVVTGEVIVKEKTLGSRFKHIFFGGDFQTASQYVAAEVLLPALRNLLLDALAKGSERLVLGDSGPRHQRRPINYGSRIQYNNPINTRAYLPDQKPVNRWTTSDRHSMDKFIVVDRTDAETIIERIIDIIDQYDVVSSADVLELLGQPSSHIDQKWGWTQIPKIDLRQVREGYELSFPPLEEIQ